MQKIFLSLLVFISLNAFSMELINQRSVSSADNVKLFTNHRDIFVEDDNAAYRVEKYNVNPLFQEVMHRKAMGKFTEDGQGYFRVKKLSDGKYLLEAKVRGDGGFLLTGVIVYNTCRVVGYSGIVLASISAVGAGFATGGPGGAVIAASAAIQASGPAAALVESSSLAIGTAASFIPLLP
jgi:hypothetical protein